MGVVNIEVEKRTYPTALTLGLTASLFPQLSQVFPTGLMRKAATSVVAEVPCSMKPTWNPLTIADLTAVPTEGANCQCCCSLVTKLCLNLCNLTDCSLAGSSVHGILQARTLEWVAISFSREASWPTDWTQLFCNGRQILYHWATREAHSRGQIQAPIEHHSQHWWAEGTSQPTRWYTGEFPSWGEKQSVLIKIATSSGCKFVFLVLDFSIRSS